MTNVIKGAAFNVVATALQMKEYRTLYFKDDTKGREAMQSEVNRLSEYGWQLSNTQAIDQGYGIAGATLFGIAGKRRSQIMVVMERERGGDYPDEPVDDPAAKLREHRELQKAKRESQRAKATATNDTAAKLISNVFPGYAAVYERQKARAASRNHRTEELIQKMNERRDGTKSRG